MMTGQLPTRNNLHDSDKSDTMRYERMLSISRSAILSLNADLQIEHVTPSITNLSGYTAGALIGLNYSELIAPGYRESFSERIKTHGTIQFDYPLVNTKGEWCWVRHTGEASEDDSALFEFIIQDVSHYKKLHSQAETERDMLREIIDNIPAAIYATDTNGKFIFSNRAHADLLNKSSSEDILGLGYEDVFSEELKQHFDLQDQQIFDTGDSINNEEVVYSGDDGEKWLSTSKLAMYDSQNQINGIIGIARNITQEKFSQQRLASSEARHRALLDALPDMMFVIRRDSIITELRTTPEVKSLGIDTSIVGKAIKESSFPQPLIDEVSLYLDIDLDYQYVQTFEFGQGTGQEIEDHFEARLVRLNDAEIMALVRNVTPLKRIQDELNRHIKDLNIVRQVNVELSATLNDDYVSQLALDAALRVSNAQAGFLAMVQTSGIMTLKDIFGQYNLEDLDNLLNPPKGIVARVIKSKKPELIFDVSSDDDYIPLLEDTRAMMVIPLISNEQIVGVMTLEARKSERFSHERFQFLQLITGRIAAFLDNAMLHRQTEEQYKEVRYLEQLKTDMIRIASHDLKNPIAGIMGYMEMFRLDVNERLSDREKGYLDRIETATKKMQRIITGILSLERIQQLSDQQVAKAINLKELVYGSVSENMDYAVRSKQTIERYLPDDDIFILGDAPQIHEALSNLVSNAIKYSPEQGKIDVSLSIEKGIAKVRVVDTGYGIPDDQQERLFAPFYRAVTTETRFIEGTGLGLHLVKNIIERHNGEMIFESEYGKGSTFGFDIPIIPPDVLDDTEIDLN